jgi:hypothetical protein
VTVGRYETSYVDDNRGHCSPPPGESDGRSSISAAATLTHEFIGDTPDRCGRIYIGSVSQDGRRIDIGSYYGDYSKIRVHWTSVPAVPLAEGLQRINQYYRRYRLLVRRAVPFLELCTQYRQVKAEIDRAIQSVLDCGVFVFGGQVAAFEKEFAAYLGVPHAVGVSSGTDALRLALLGGVGPG